MTKVAVAAKRAGPGRPTNAELGLPPRPTPAQRRARSDADKVARGEQRINTWIDADAAAALAAITGADQSRGAIREALSLALVAYAQTLPKRRKS
jgi:hypothetical protein